MRTKLRIDSKDQFRRRLAEKEAMNAEHARRCLASQTAALKGGAPCEEAKHIVVGKPAFCAKF